MKMEERLAQVKDMLESLVKNKKVLIGIIVAICLFVLIVSGFNYLKDKNKEDKDALKTITNISVAKADILDKQNVIDGLNLLTPYETTLITTITDKKKSTADFDNQNISIPSYIVALTANKKTLTESIAAIKKIICSPTLNNYKADILNENSIILDGINHELIYITNKDAAEMTVSKQSYDKFASAYNSSQEERKSINSKYKLSN
jgi:hypothetical protein